METDKHYLRVGSFVLLTILALAAFFVWFVGAYDNSKYTTYRMHFAESVSGLDVGGPVKFRGVRVGKVKSLLIDPRDTRLIQVDVNILKSTPIKTDTVANLKLQGITGGIYIELNGGDAKAPPLANNDENTPPEIPTQSSTLSEIMDILPQILQKVSHIAEQVDKIFNDQNIASFNDMVAEWQKISHDVDGLTRSLKDDPSKIIIPSKEKGIPAP